MIAGERYASFECDTCDQPIGVDGRVTIAIRRSGRAIVLTAICAECHTKRITLPVRRRPLRRSQRPSKAT